MIEMIRVSLRAARVNAGLSQKDAAEKLGVCVSTLQNYELGKTVPQHNFVQNVSKLYGIPIDNIFFSYKTA